MTDPIDIPTFLETLTNPRWGDSNHTSVILDATYNGNTVTFLATPTDIVEYGVTVYNNAVAEDYGTIGPYVPYIPPVNMLKAQLIEAAQETCDFISGKIYPNTTVQTAFILVGAASAAGIPSSGPLHDKATSLASVYQISLDQLETVITALQDASMELALAQESLRNVVESSDTTTSFQLASILSSFQTSITFIVTGINAVIPRQIPSPATIQIVGINV